jgi:hypothetical protein
VPDLTPDPPLPDGPPSEVEELALQPVDPPGAPVPLWRRRGPVLGAAAGLVALALAGAAVLVATSGGSGQDALVATVSPSVSLTPSPLPSPSEEPLPDREPTEAEQPAPAAEVAPPAPAAEVAPPETAAAAPAPDAAPPAAAPAPAPAATTAAPGPTPTPSPARTVAEPGESTVTLVNESTLELEFVFQFSDHDRSTGGPGYDRTERHVVPAGGRLTVFLRNSGFGTGTAAYWTRDRACAWEDGDGPGPKPGSTSSVIVRHAGDGPHPACGGQRELMGEFSPEESWRR